MTEGAQDMVSPPDPLLAPIPGNGGGAGEDLRYDPVFDLIQEARREDDTTTPQGIWTTKVKRADWAAVRAETETVLRTRSKDLQVAAWLLEAWLQIDGMSGLTRGLRLLTSLSLQFWPVLHPGNTEDDPEVRLAPFFWLEAKLPARIATVPLTLDEGSDAPALSWQDFQAAQRLEQIATTAKADRDQAVADGVPTLARFDAAVRATPDTLFERLGADLRSAADSLQALGATLDQLCGPDSPSFSGIERTIDLLSHFVRRTLADRGFNPPPMAAAAQARTIGQPDEGAGQLAERPAVIMPPRSAGPIASREQAYRLLAEVADYLSRAEPHSPTPYLLRRAVSWGRMSLPELLQELMEDDGGRRTVQKLLRMPEE